MDTILALFLFLGLSAGQTVPEVSVKARCPTDYRRRVETCIMEAQLAPQAGGGITLVLNKDTIVNLCDRGILRKTIDCLEEIHARCVHNVTVLQELDRLYSGASWEQGAQLICEDTQLFQNNFHCLSHSATSVTSCILMRTHTFRMGLAFADPSDHARVRDITCSFAESIVKCVCSPLEGTCPMDLTKRVAGGMRFFLPPFCIDDIPTPTPTTTPTSMPDAVTKSTTTTTTATTTTTTTTSSTASTTRPAESTTPLPDQTVQAEDGQN
ncbi:uncharacterized protein LOC143299499 [Babylonia areolata]|uniref:uncharacterized protein LOC143299499 n=1 Tax=Babylonia areolata TaxID=304850 RepID=UPI003FD337D8